MKIYSWIRCLCTAVLLTIAANHAEAKSAVVTEGLQGFNAVKRCVMENSQAICHDALTLNSYPLFDRFFSYKLMPCIPTDFVYDSETVTGSQVTVKAIMPASNNSHYVLKMVFDRAAQGLKFNIPESLHRGLGENWENKIQLSEQLYLMMKQNMGNKLTCDTLNGLIQPSQ